jgi:hypothetical protein
MKSLDLELSVFSEAEGLESQRNLFRDAFPEALGSAVETVRFYRWKFQQRPFGRPALECAVWSNSEMLGYYAGIQMDYRLAGRPAQAGMVCDVMTHSKARGAGIFTKLGRYSLDYFKTQQIDFTLGYPVRPEVFPGHYRVGWQKAFDLPVYFRPTNPSWITSNRVLSVVLALADGFLKLSAKVASSFARFLGAQKLSLDAVDLDSFSSVFASGDLQRRVERQFPNVMLRTPDFYRWRLSAPDASYDLILMRDGQRNVEGWVVARRFQLKGLWCWAILDYYCFDRRLRTQFQNFAKLSSLASSRKVVGLALMMSRSSARTFSLACSGFIRLPYKFSLIFKCLSEKFSDSEFKDEKLWHLMWIDTDDL